MPERTILVMAGGTGGHVYPALAVAEYLRDRGVKLFWMGTRAGIESRIVPEKGFPLLLVHVKGLRGKTILRRLLAPFMLFSALLQSVAIMLRYKPDAVLGLGGFASGPGGIAASLLRIPLYIHEQNAIAGLTNKLLAPFARLIMLGFPGAIDGRNVITTGNPVRKPIQQIESPEPRMTPRKDQPLRLLILGGSLGAAALNEIIPSALAGLPKPVQVEVWHQTGNAHIEITRRYYHERGLDKARIDAFIDDMTAAYTWADLVICRSGASTVAEICSAGVASILVPYPYAVDDHQTANAKFLSDEGAAILLPQKDITVDHVIGLIARFYDDRDRLLWMAITARRKAFPDAVARIAAICLGETVHA